MELILSYFEYRLLLKNAIKDVAGVTWLITGHKQPK